MKKKKKKGERNKIANMRRKSFENVFNFCIFIWYYFNFSPLLSLFGAVLRVQLSFSLLNVFTEFSWFVV